MNTMVLLSWDSRAISSSCISRRMRGSRPLKGFVHEQDFRVDSQGPSKAYPLLHAATHFPWEVVLPTLEPHGFDGLGGEFVPLFPLHAPHLESVGDVVHDAAVGGGGP